LKPIYEPILERQIHHLINYAQGVMHIGQRDIAWLRVSKQAVEKGFRLKHIGVILHAKLHQDFGRIFDKLQVTIYTDESHVKQIVEQARAAYAERDARIEGMTDESTDTYYSCLLCQSFAPSHVCIISRREPVFAALTTGWIAKHRMKSIRPVRISPYPKAKPSMPNWDSGKA